MKAWSRITDYIAALLLALVALVAGYVIGSIRGAHLASLQWRILHAHFAYGVADAMRTGKSDCVLPDSRGVAHSIYQGVAGDPWLHERLLIPVVEWGEYPTVSFGVGDAERHLTERVGQFLSETDKTSNHAVEPTRAPAGASGSP